MSKVVEDLQNIVFLRAPSHLIFYYANLCITCVVRTQTAAIGCVRSECCVRSEGDAEWEREEY